MPISCTFTCTQVEQMCTCTNSGHSGIYMGFLKVVHTNTFVGIILEKDDIMENTVLTIGLSAPCLDILPSS